MSSANFLALLAGGVLLLNLLVVALSMLSLYTSRAQYEGRAILETRNLAQVLAQDLASAFDKSDLALLALSDEISRQVASARIDGQVVNAFISRQLARRPDLGDLRYADPKGDIVYGTGVLSDSTVSIADRDYFIRLRDDPNVSFVFSKPIVGRISRNWVIVHARRVDGVDGSFAGVVFSTISLERLQKKFSALNLGRDGAVSVRNVDQLNLITRYTTQENGSAPVGSNTISRELHEILQSNPVAGTYTAHTKIDGIERANAYRRISNYPFYILIGRATDEFLAPWRDEAVKTAILVAVFVVVTLALSVLIGHSWRLRGEMSRRVVAVQEEERRRLAAELHDNTSPNLAALSLNLGMIAADLASPPPTELEARITDTRALLAKTTAGIRDVCAYLRPATLEYASLSQALREYAEQFSRRTGITVNVSGPDATQRLAPEFESMLFRVAQEALTNSAKHAKASAINIDLASNGVHAVLTITDYGGGFDPKALGRSEQRPGLGLLSMRERVEMAGGNFSIESEPGKGTRIRVEI